MKRFTKILFLIAVLTLAIAPAFVFAGDTTGTATTATATPNDLGTLLFTVLTPLVVYGATWALGYFLPKIPSVIVTSFAVPIVSALASYVASLAGTPHVWYVTLLLGLGGTFIHEFQKNIGNALPPAPPKV